MYEKRIKRFIDFSTSLIGLIILFPIIIIVSIVSLLINKGNPFFYQQRPGKNEVVFKIIKFKTMNDLKDKNGDLLPDKMRITKWGTFLRKTSLDEIPQLFNVVKGEMSLIGPRPLMVKYLPYYTSIEKKRHDVRPGITGLAQVSGRNHLSWNDKLNFDVKYINDLSFKLDLKILIKTFYKIISTKDVVVDTYSVEPDLDEVRKNTIC